MSSEPHLTDVREAREGITFRRADRADAPAVRALVDAAYAVYLERMPRRPAPLDVDHVATIADADVRLAHRGERLVGALVVRQRDDHLVVENIAVHPDAQGCGIGSFLLDVVDEIACAAELHEIHLYTNVAMTENLTFYPKHGYNETHRSTDDGFARVHFARHLD